MTTAMYIARITKPALIQRIVNKRPRIVLGVISPYLEMNKSRIGELTNDSLYESFLNSHVLVKQALVLHES